MNVANAHFSVDERTGEIRVKSMPLKKRKYILYVGGSDQVLSLTQSYSVDFSYCDSRSPSGPSNRSSMHGLISKLQQHKGITRLLLHLVQKDLVDSREETLKQLS